MIQLLQIVPRTIYAGYGRNFDTAVALPAQGGTFQGLFMGIRFKGKHISLSAEHTSDMGTFRPDRKVADVPITIELDDSFATGGFDSQTKRVVLNCRLVAFLAESHVLAFPEGAKGFNAEMRQRGAGQRRRLQWMQAPRKVWLAVWGAVPDDSWSVLP